MADQEQIPYAELRKEAENYLQLVPYKGDSDATIQQIMKWLETALEVPLKENTRNYPVVDIDDVGALAWSIKNAYEADPAHFKGKLDKNPLHPQPDGFGSMPPAKPDASLPVETIVRTRINEVLEDRIKEATLAAGTLADKFEISPQPDTFADQLEEIRDNKRKEADQEHQKNGTPFTLTDEIRIQNEMLAYLDTYTQEVTPLVRIIEGNPSLVADIHAHVVPVIVATDHVAETEAAYRGLGDADRVNGVSKEEALKKAKGELHESLDAAYDHFTGEDDRKVFNYILKQALKPSGPKTFRGNNAQRQTPASQAPDEAEDLQEAILAQLGYTNQTPEQDIPETPAGAPASPDNSSQKPGSHSNSKVPLLLAAGSLGGAALGLYGSKPKPNPTTGKKEMKLGFAGKIAVVAGTVGLISALCLRGKEAEGTLGKLIAGARGFKGDVFGR